MQNRIVYFAGFVEVGYKWYQLTYLILFAVKEVQSKILMIKNKKKSTTVCFSLMGLSGGVETKQNGKTPQYISHVSSAAPKAL